MGKRKDTDMNALQEMLEEMIRQITETGMEDALPFGDGDEITMPENLQIEIRDDLTGENMLDDLDKDDLLDLAGDMYDPEPVSKRLALRTLRKKVREFILNRPERFLAMLPGSAVDALIETLQSEVMQFEEWEEDLDMLTESGYCCFDVGEKVLIPSEYAVLYREVTQDPAMRRKLDYWAQLEDAAADILLNEMDPVALGDLVRMAAKDVPDPEKRRKKSEKVVAFSLPGQLSAEQEEEIRYMLRNRLTGWDTDFMIIEEKDDVYLVAMDWDEAMEGFEEFLSGEWDEEDDDIWDDDDWDDDDED